MASRVISCYSYKGGAGRTTGSANLAFALACRQKRVCLIDLDIEAPGLQSVLGLEDSMLQGGHMQQLLISDAEGAVDVETFAKQSPVDLREADLPELEGCGGDFLFIPSSAAPMEGINVSWKGFQPVNKLNRLFSMLEEEHGTDYFVLDIASGLRNSSVVPWAVSDLVLVFFKWSRQHLRGTIEAYRLFEALRSSSTSQITADYMLVPSAVPATETFDESTPEGRLLAVAYETAQRSLETGTGIPIETINALEIGEIELLKWEEQILPAGASNPFNRLADAVLGRLSQSEGV
jgi:MinD-like ATPase involved in chromosome partitioning or flagellar assembly